MWIETETGKRYCYHRSDNRIYEGSEDEDIAPLEFIPLAQIDALPDIDTFILCVTEKCNLRCSYCCYSGTYAEHRSHGTTSMTPAQIPSILDFIRRYARKHHITISFYGGESLLCFDFIKAFIQEAAQNLDFDIRYEISTNGLLLSYEVIRWIVENGIELFLSVDGTKDIHDRQRHTSDGRGSFDKVIEAISYIKLDFPNYLSDKLHLLMTVQKMGNLREIAMKWHMHPVLKDIAPGRISFVADNYAKGVNRSDYDEMKSQVKSLIEAYDSHTDWVVLNAFFKYWLTDWIQRPLFTIDRPQAYPTCVPDNHKLYITANGSVGLCEKISDDIRFGNLNQGIDWAQLQSCAAALSLRIKARCAKCEIARVCGICPSVLHLSDPQMDIYCNNQRVTSKLKLYALCELAERGLL